MVEKARFRQIALTDMTVNVQDLLSRNFRMQVGAVGESITVSGNKAYVNTVSGTVSTVVDQHFVDNMPLNGRSFQSLLALAPGVVFTSVDLGFGQFSVNGQRSDANYWMVDGVSANFGIASGFSTYDTLPGTTPALTSGGGTNGLVSVDAMQEFRIQTSTYAPEFGRTPGGQVSIVTKSGTNQFHGVAFDYLRNDVFDARNWFDQPPLPKPPLRQNDFGGTVGGPLKKDQLFFFFSYEGLRLLLPQTASSFFYHEVCPRCGFPGLQTLHECAAASVCAAGRPHLRQCHQSVYRPSRHCLFRSIQHQRNQYPHGLHHQQED